MVAYPGLQKRGSRYSIRVRVPDELQAIIGKREITKALRTADKREAVERLRVVRVDVDSLFRAARRKLLERPDRFRPKEAPEPTSDVVVDAIKAWLGEAQRQALSSATLAQDHDLDGTLANLRSDIAALSGPAAAEEPGIQKLAGQIVKELGYELRPGSPTSWLAAELTAQAAAEHVRRVEGRLTSDARPFFNPAFSDVTATTAPAKQRGLTFGELIERFCSNPARKVSPKTQLADKAAHGVLGDIIGRSTPLAMIDREACRRVQSIVQRLPTNFSKMQPRRSPEQAADQAAKMGLPPIASKTANSYLGALAAVFRFAESEGLVHRNPARGLLLAGDAGSVNRRPFSADELKRLFAAAPYPGGAREADFWLPLLGLFTGARLNELCQLGLCDIERRDDVEVLAMREDASTGKRLKTKNAVRIVPLHPELRRIGFCDHVDRMRRAGGERLFPELRPAASGYISDIYSKRFSRRLRGLGITDRAVSFHSFRHSFRDALREAGVAQEIARALGGWSRGENASEGYGSGFRPSTLAAEIGKVAYPDLDFSMLHSKSA